MRWGGRGRSCCWTRCSWSGADAKCVVVDARWVFVTSANFTDRGQTRTIEVGVLLEDVHLAAVLESQFSTGSGSQGSPDTPSRRIESGACVP